MPKDQDDGGPAFPGKQSPDAETVKALRDGAQIGLHEASSLLSEHGGMSLRDWFAGQALAGIASSCTAGGIRRINSGEHDGSVSAKAAYKLADAMIAARRGKE